MSIRGGLSRAVERAGEVDATALQIFVKSSRQWAAAPLARAETLAFRRAVGRSGLDDALLAHACYLVNLASPDPVVWRRSIAAVRDELARCARLGIPYLVLHPGSHLGTGEAAGLERVARALDRLLAPRGRPAAAGPAILLEITAGQGACLGHRFEHLRRILELTAAEPRLGVCFDTCHAHAAGYGLEHAADYRATFDAFERLVGCARIRAFHLNDSRGARASRVDRHAHIGQGSVGLAGFKRLLNDPRFAAVPMVIETPKDDDLGQDRLNLAALRRLVPRSRR
jgi:deoxyribonuclease-4